MKARAEDNTNLQESNTAIGLTAFGLNQLNILNDSRHQIPQLSPASLAYLGDAVYELFIRTLYLTPPKRSHAYHQQVVAHVKAESQAETLRSLTNHLTEAELEIVRRGRNATTGKPRRLDPEIYQQATSLETLIGYLYISNPQRLTELLALLEFEQP